MKHPLPDAALDGRICIVGISGSGKSTTAKGGVERLLEQGRRVCVVDLLDGWWGLRLKRDGKTPAYPVAIFGGQHGDLPLTEHAGALIGQAVAQSEGSTIVSLSELDGDAARRRFALAFFNALYNSNRAPLHLVIDEADFYAPQNPPKGGGREGMYGEGPAPLLLNRVKEIAARGRMRGFRCWPITQRPAKLHKDVLSQADTLIAMQLTSSQDRGAIEGWIGDQGDKDVGKTILASLPSLKLGQGVLWSPRIGVLEATHFPLPATYDSSRTPEYGEKATSVELKPIDLGALREKMGKVEAEAKAKDPVELRKEIARLKAELAKKPVAPAAAPINAKPEQIEAARKRGWDARGREDRDLLKAALIGAKNTHRRLGVIADDCAEMRTQLQDLVTKLEAVPELPADTAPAPLRQPLATASSSQVGNPSSRSAKPSTDTVADGLSRPQQRILDALAWLEMVGVNQADRVRAAFLADQSHRSSGYEKNVSTLSGRGLISYPGPGLLMLTEEGRGAAHRPDQPPTDAELHASIASKISGPQWALLEQLIAAYPGALTREELANAANVSSASSGFEKNVSTLSGLGFVHYPVKRSVAALPILFVE